ncbi:hypothetical protein ACFL6I_14940 [candidate division KSB1 bacterium]
MNHAMVISDRSGTIPERYIENHRWGLNFYEKNERWFFFLCISLRRAMEKETRVFSKRFTD